MKNNMSPKVKLLIYDLETTPMLGWSYKMWDTNIIKIERQAYIMCFSYMWYGEDKIHCVLQSDFPARYKDDPYNDYDVVKRLRDLLDEADLSIAYNGKRFDDKIAMTRIMFHDMEIPSPFKSVDPLQTARGKLKLPSNSLDNLCEYFGIKGKTDERHGDLWHLCVNGNKKAWELMKRYCDNDVRMLKQVYEKLLPVITNHPNLSVLSQRPDACPRCQSTSHIQYRGTRSTNVCTYRRVTCDKRTGGCGAWFGERESLKDDYVKPTYVNYN